MIEHSGWGCYRNLSDEALCRRLSDGDVAAQDELAQRYFAMVRRRARVFQTRGVETDDLVQEGMVGLIYAMRAYRPDRGATFKTFAYRCITNRMLSSVVAAGKIPPSVLYDSVGEPFATVSQNDDDPQEILIKQEDADRWTQRLTDLLSEFEKEALRLYLSGFSYQAMAQTLHSTTKAVDNALQRVRRKLRAV